MASADFLLAHGLLLVYLLVVVLILHASVFLKGSPVVLQLCHFFTQTVAIHAEPFRVLDGIRELSTVIGQLITLLLQ